MFSPILLASVLQFALLQLVSQDIWETCNLLYVYTGWHVGLTQATTTLIQGGRGRLVEQGYSHANTGRRNPPFCLDLWTNNQPWRHNDVCVVHGGQVIRYFSPQAKKYSEWQFGTCRDSSLLCRQNRLQSPSRYIHFSSAHGRCTTGVLLVDVAARSPCTFKWFDPAKCFLMWYTLSDERSAPQLQSFLVGGRASSTASDRQRARQPFIARVHNQPTKLALCLAIW